MYERINQLLPTGGGIMGDSKSKLEIVLMPLAVALVGIAGSLIISNYQSRNASLLVAAQNDNASKLAKAQTEAATEKANADRQIKVLEIFSKKITGEDRDREIALRILRALDPDLHEKLASAVAESEPKDSEIGGLALKEKAIADQRKFIAAQAKPVVKQKAILIEPTSICEKYNSYTSEKWENNFLKGYQPGKWDVYVASLARGADLEEAKRVVADYDRRFPKHKFKSLGTYSSYDENSRYAILIAQGLEDVATAREIAAYADKCGIAKGAYPYRQF
jgi:hypothetical protein